MTTTATPAPATGALTAVDGYVEAPTYEIVWNGDTVWVNGFDGAIGRFSRFGIDVHTTDAAAAATECLYCTHTLPDAAGWATFVTEMATNHQIAIPAESRPAWVADAA